MAMVVCNGHLEEPIEVQGIVASCMESLPWQRDRCSSGVNRQTFDCTLPEPREGTWRYLHGRHNIESPARSRCSVSHRNKVDGPPSQNDRPTTDKRSPATAAAAAVGTAQRRVQLRAATLEPSCWHRAHSRRRPAAPSRSEGRQISAPATRRPEIQYRSLGRLAGETRVSGHVRGGETGVSRVKNVSAKI